MSKNVGCTTGWASKEGLEAEPPAMSSGPRHGVKLSEAEKNSRDLHQSQEHPLAKVG